MYIPIRFSDFYLVEGANYVRLSEFPRFSKCDNDVITCRGVRYFEWKPQLVGGCQKLPLYAKKSHLETVQFLQSTRNIQTNITHIYTTLCFNIDYY